jgi:hypothetical protein
VNIYQNNQQNLCEMAGEYGRDQLAGGNLDCIFHANDRRDFPITQRVRE